MSAANIGTCSQYTYVPTGYQYVVAKETPMEGALRPEGGIGCELVKALVQVPPP